jgi:hypothetical protein
MDRALATQAGWLAALADRIGGFADGHLPPA